MPETDTASTPQLDPKADSANPEQPDPDPIFTTVNECRGAYFDALNDYEDSHGGPGKASEYLGKQEAKDAYRNSLPILSSRNNILAFMACVAEGVLIEAIPENVGSKLIYAAQAALGALPPEPKPQKRQKAYPPTPRGASKVNSDPLSQPVANT